MANVSIITLVLLMSIVAVYGWNHFGINYNKLSEESGCGPNECEGDNGNCIADGARTTDNPCNLCRCIVGGVACPVYRCDPTCEEEFSQQCCANCKNAQSGCGPSECEGENGNCLADGAPWSDDQCELCQCLGGRKACSMHRCDPTCAEEFPLRCCAKCRIARAIRFHFRG